MRLEHRLVGELDHGLLALGPRPVDKTGFRRPTLDPELLQLLGQLLLRLVVQLGRDERHRHGVVLDRDLNLGRRFFGCRRDDRFRRRVGLVGQESDRRVGRRRRERVFPGILASRPDPFLPRHVLGGVDGVTRVVVVTARAAPVGTEKRPKLLSSKRYVKNWTNHNCT